MRDITDQTVAHALCVEKMCTSQQEDLLALTRVLLIQDMIWRDRQTQTIALAMRDTKDRTAARAINVQRTRTSQQEETHAQRVLLIHTTL